MHSANWALIIVLHLLSGVVAISGQHQALKPYVGTNNNVDLYVNSTTAGRVLVNGQDIVSCVLLHGTIAFSAMLCMVNSPLINQRSPLETTPTSGVMAQESGARASRATLLACTSVYPSPDASPNTVAFAPR